MKTIRNSLLILVLILSQNVNAQLKVLNNGYISLGGTTVPTNFSLNINFNKFIFGKGTPYSNAMGFDFWSYDPRMWSGTGKIVLFNSVSLIYNDLEIRTLYQHSDIKDKINIAQLTDGLGTIKKLRGVSYNWKKQVTENDKKKNYGLIAQEVETVIPESTITDSLGNKMLSYNAIIPYLIEAVKDLSAQVESLKKQSPSSSSSSSLTSTFTISEQDIAKLFQNNPNPFSQSTEIGYYLPESIITATIYVYDLQGLQILVIPIQQRGTGNATISATELKAGMYIYTLIADNKVIDSKRMILTQ